MQRDALLSAFLFSCQRASPLSRDFAAPPMSYFPAPSHLVGLQDKFCVVVSCMQKKRRYASSNLRPEGHFVFVPVLLDLQYHWKEDTRTSGPALPSYRKLSRLSPAWSRALTDLGSHEQASSPLAISCPC